MDNEGLLRICTIQNTAEPGEMPADRLVPQCYAYYKKRTVGYNRIYAALGANQQVDMVVRCSYTPAPVYGDEQYVVFEDGAQYQITAVQEILDADAIDLTLVRLEDLYDVYDPENR